MMACKRNNITLIEIPYWWDRYFLLLFVVFSRICNRKVSSLAATILQFRGDITFINKYNGIPIPTQDPTKGHDLIQSHIENNISDPMIQSEFNSKDGD
jgi:hypothetical protein